MSLRDTIKKALGDKWTQELEDQLFWPLSEFCNRAVDSNLNALRKEIKNSLQIQC